MRRTLHAALAVFGVLSGLVAPAAARQTGVGAGPAGEPLPTDPRLVTGQFDNGLRYMVRQHDNPPGRAYVWLHVSTGSLNEGEAQRGLAHFLEHMAFNGSENFAPGTVIDFFQSLGMTFGMHQNAYTIFDKTVYQLSLPDTKPETLGKGLLFLSDVAFRLTLPAEEIEKERQVIQEERRGRLGGYQRVFDKILEGYAPGSLFGRRLPIGLEETIDSMQQEDFVEYYKTRYVPGNMTLLVVADADPQAVVARLEEYFGKAPGAEVPPDQDPGITLTQEKRAIVAADPEVALAQMSIARVSPVNPPVTTVEGMRRQLVRMVASGAFNRRMQRKVAEGGVAFQSGSATVSDMFRAIRLIEATAGSEPAKWEQSLADLGAEVRRAALHGFSEQEVDDVRRQMISQAERSVEVEPTIPARALLAVMDEAVSEGEPMMSAAQYRDLVARLVPTITPEEVSLAFARLFDPGDGACLFILTVPSTARVPTEEQLVALGVKALAVSPESGERGARATQLLAERPTPGEVVEESLHEPSQVWSGWLSNGVRFHYRFMDYRKDTVSVAVLLAGGELQEAGETRGRAEAAAVAWTRPATSTLSSPDLRDLMIGKKVQVRGQHGLDTMSIGISGNPGDLEAGFQQAYLMLTDPVIEPAAFDQWRAQQEQLLAYRAASINLVFSDTITDTLYPKGEARVRPLTGGQLSRLDREEAQRWLRELAATAPMEVTVVGDIERERALELVTTYLGSLPARERVSEATLDGLRDVERPAGPLEASKTVPTETDQAWVLSGFFGAPITNVVDNRLLTAAATILTTRMTETLRERDGLVYSIGAQAAPGLELEQYGTVHAVSSTAPEKAATLRERLESMFTEFAREGPTDEEMAVMKKQVANRLDERMREPAYWLRAVSGSTYRGTSVQDAVDEPAAFEAMTGEQVREAFARFYRPGARFEVSVSPAPAAPDPAANGPRP